MDKFSGVYSLKRFELKSLSPSVSGAAKTLAISSRASPESASLGSFANLKLTAEKLVKEQASTKTDLELANCKVKKFSEDIRVLEQKLQNAFNENAKLKVKQKEDQKLWKGLESKFSSSKTLCDQLTDTLQHLTSQVQDAEKDKLSFEGRLSAYSASIDNLHEQMKTVLLRLESSEETVKTRERELKELCLEKEEVEKSLNTELKGAFTVIEEKEAMIRTFEAAVAANGLAIESLNSKLQNLDLDMRQKEENIKSLRNSKEDLQKEKDNILSINIELSAKLQNALQETKNLKEFANLLTVKLVDLNSQSLKFSEKVVELICLFESGFKLLEDKRQLAASHVQRKFDKLQDNSTRLASDKDVLQIANQELNNKLTELQKEQDFAMVQHAEECRLAEEKICRLESEEETLQSQKNEMEVLITKLRENVRTLSEKSRLSEREMQDVLLKISELEIEKENSIKKLQEDVTKKQGEIDDLNREMENRDKQIDSLEKQICQLNVVLEVKDKLVVELKIREKQLEDHKTKIEESLTDAETKRSEAKEQYNQMLESKQLEFSRQLKEMSEKNDQAINEIRRKYEVEKLDSVNFEKEKADKLIGEMERKCEQKLEECKEESRQNLSRVQEEHAGLISRFQQERDKQEVLVSDHTKEIKRIELQAENEMIEKTTMLRNEHEAHIRALQCEHDDECRRLQEELDIQKSKWEEMGDNPQDEQEVSLKRISCIQRERDEKELLLVSAHTEVIKRMELQAEKEMREKITMLQKEHEARIRAFQCEHDEECRRSPEELDVQKSKEERQRDLVQLPWNVMGGNPQGEQEVSSNKNHSISSAKMRNSGKGIHHTADRREVKDMDSPFLKATQTPVSNLLRNVDKENTEVTPLPKHSRKVTRHEYEVETTNGRTITKKRKTKSTVMFGNTPKARTPRTTRATTKGRNDTSPDMGAMFLEGSLNPYADDPYAFD